MYWGGRLAFQRRANATAQIEAEEAMQAQRAQQMVSWLTLSERLTIKKNET